MFIMGLALGSTYLTPLGSLLDPYLANNNFPKYVADFTNDNYVVNSAPSTFDTALTHSRAGLATMVDSEGKLVWGAHNLVSNSTDMSQLNIQYAGLTGNTTPAPDSKTFGVELTSSSHYGGFRPSIPVVAGVKYYAGVCLKGDPQNTIRLRGDGAEFSWRVFGVFDLQNPSGNMIDLGDGWFYCWGELTADETGNVNVVCGPAVDGIDATFYAWGFHIFRSDLGGMAKVPEHRRVHPDLEYYVPTNGTAVYLPREHHHVYEGGQWVDTGVLVEPQGTNLVTHSGDLTNAIWNDVKITVSSEGDGVFRLTETVDASPGHYFNRDDISVTVGTSYCWSIDVKKGAGSAAPDWIVLGFNLTGFGSIAANFNVSTGQFGNVDAGITTFVQDMSDGWFRATVCAEAIEDETGSAGIVGFNNDSNPANPNFPAYAGSTDADLLVRRPQFEEGSVPSSYIPTNGSQVTRAADTLTVPSSALPAGNSELSIAWRGRVSYADGGAADEAVLASRSVDANNRVRLVLDTDSGGTGSIAAEQAEGGTTDRVVGTDTYSPGTHVAISAASRHTSGAVQVAHDGTAVTADTTPTALANLSATDMTLTPSVPTSIEQLLVWPTDIGETGLEEGSSYKPIVYGVPTVEVS